MSIAAVDSEFDVRQGPLEGAGDDASHEALLKTLALQSAIFNSANFSSIATDADGVIQIFNVGAERMLGYAAAEVVNRITPADISDPLEVVARAEALSIELSTRIAPGFEALVFKASRGIEDIYELTYIRKDGSRFPAVVSVTALRDSHQGIIGYLLIGTDNTARGEAEEALREHDALLHSIHLHSIVSVTDHAGCIVEVNDGFCKISGYSRDELLGQTHRIVNSGVQDAAFWTEMWQSVSAGRPWRGEICNRTKDGALYWVDSIIAPFIDEGGHTKKYISIRTDVTARKLAEEALLKAGALQSAIFNSANFSSIATDANGVIQIFNVGAERMLGYVAADVMNKITPADISDSEELIARARALSAELGTPITPGFEALVFKASRGIEDIYELTYVRKDGSRFPAVVSVTALRDGRDAIIGYLLIGTDNTERKQAEEARTEMNAELGRAKLVAEKANLAKSDFLSSMSHELRSPLNAILGFAQLMESGTPPPTAGQTESIEQILQAGWYLLELINEILDLSLIESGKVSLSLESMSMAEVLSDYRAMIEPQAKKTGIRMRFPVFDGPHFVKADRTRVKQICVNLLSNAIKYNRPGGEVEVSCETTSPTRTRISFRDTGAGLSEDKVAQLFQPFNRLGRETGAEEGTGIGLVVSKRLVELMGGEIGATSTVGVGSVFWIELDSTPAVEMFEAPDAPTLTPPRIHADSHRYTVLCVEDNQANLMLIQKLVARRPDIRLLTARDGTRGIEIARAETPSLILMDINLPGINGIQAMKILATMPSTASIPVIALSANAMPHDISRGMEAGFFHYLTKPIKVNEFMESLDGALTFSSALSNHVDPEPER